MSKLTKAEAKAHKTACDLLKKDRLSDQEKEFVFANWREDAEHINSSAGAFFTPLDLARDFAIEVSGRRVIDLCAGIGALSWAVRNRDPFGSGPDLTCIEINPAYVEVGRKLVPEARWICASIFDVLDMGIGRFDCAISNPPFSQVNRDGKNAPRYSGRDFEFHVIDIAAHLAGYGVFILPQMSAGFNYSGRDGYERQTSGKAVEFQKRFGLHFGAGCGVDTALYQRSWRGVSPLCEIVCVDFDGEDASAEPAARAEAALETALESAGASTGQLSLFEHEAA